MSSSERFERPIVTPKDARIALREFDRRVDEVLEGLRAEAEQFARMFEGTCFRSHQANQRLAARLRALFDRARVDCVCPKPGCGKPGRIVAIPTRDGRTVSNFVIEHPRSGTRKSHRHECYTAFPALVLVSWDKQVPPRPKLRRRRDE